MLFIRRSYDKLLLLLAAATVFCLLSYQPKSRINAQMPPEFLDVSGIRNPRQRMAEERLAKMYWGCVVGNIQWEYTYGSRLPQDPPPEFAPAGADITAVDTATRARYWQKLQEVWYLPTVWEKHYEWDTRWTTSWMDQVKSVGDWLYSRLSSDSRK